MTAKERERIINIFNKMSLDGLVRIKTPFGELKDAYRVDIKDYEFIEPFIFFTTEKIYKFNNNKMKTFSSPMVEVIKHHDTAYVCPLMNEYMPELKNVLEFVIYSKTPYKKWAGSQLNDSKTEKEEYR